MSYGLAAYATSLYGGPEAAVPAVGDFPQLTIELRNPEGIGGPQIWEDIGARLRSATVSRGRQFELDQYQAGTCTLVLENGDRLFDPEYVDGRYYFFLVPRGEIRIRATYGGVTYPVFHGHIERITQEYNGPEDSVAVISLVDHFRFLRGLKLESSAYIQEVVNSRPAMLLRMNEPQGTTQLTDSTTFPIPVMVNGTPTFGEDSLIAREAGTAILFDSPSEYLTIPPAQFPIRISTTHSMEFVVKLSAAPASPISLQIHYVSETGATLSVKVLANGLVEYYHGTTLVSTTSVADNQIHHIACVDTGAQMLLYIDGQLEASAASSVTAPGLGYVDLLMDDVSGVSLTVQAVAFYNLPLTADEVTAHYEALSTPWNNDTPAERLDRLVDIADFGEEWREFDTGSSVLQSADLSGITALDHAQRVGNSEFGRFFVTRDGKFRLVGRNNTVNQLEHATFGDGGGSELGYTSLMYEFSDGQIRNPVTISRSEGVAQTAEDEDTIFYYGHNDYTLEGLYHDSDAMSKDAADFILDEYKSPQTRVTGLRIVPTGSPSTLFPQVLGRELGDEIVVIRRPQGVGDPISNDLVIEGIRHSFGPMYWQTDLDTSPAISGSIWQLGVAGHSELDDTTRLFF